MNFNIRKITPNTKEIKIKHDNIDINLGFFDQEEQEQFIKMLKDTIEELER